ncbi:hypothetical protein RHSIM_Rhsim07G0191900 [Rhododendron simsii]|uniref:Bidirectional sugar transporter SWEET n=1 Tax=Rhododendron simsii TaxID=118357 RepID=A0A834LGB9_RHOSS|nr:hypothetical protein RHSIM_Rhsim07G0191900 [Rhododendron simsii]
MLASEFGDDGTVRVRQGQWEGKRQVATAGVKIIQGQWDGERQVAALIALNRRGDVGWALIVVAVGVGGGNIISLLVFASPIGTFRRVVKKKSTENFKAIPYITTLLSTSLWTFYGLLKPGGLLIVTVNVAGAVLQFVYVTLFLIYAPKDIKRMVVKTKSVEYMPFLLSFFLFLNGGVWSVYALLVKDYYVGLILYTIYKNKSPSTKSKEEREDQGSTNVIKNAIEMQGHDEDDPKV